MRTSVEYLGDALEGLLSRCVPDLELEHRLVITVTHLEKKGAELHADSDFVILHELIGGDSVHQAGLTYPGVPNYDQLEEVVLTEGRGSLACGRDYFVLDVRELGWLELIVRYHIILLGTFHFLLYYY